MRAYTLATVAITLGVTPKWLENVLSHYPVQGVSKGRQGVRRRLEPHAVVTLHLINELIRTLGLPVGEAISIAERAGHAEEIASIRLFSSAHLTIDVAEATREVGRRLALAVEVTPVPKRGRPPGK